MLAFGKVGAGPERKTDNEHIRWERKTSTKSSPGPRLGVEQTSGLSSRLTICPPHTKPGKQGMELEQPHVE